MSVTSSQFRSVVRLTLKEPPPVPLEAENLSPDVVAGLDAAAVRALPVFLGKRPLRMEDFFTVEVERLSGGEQAGAAESGAAGSGDRSGAAPSTTRLEIHGDCSRVKWIGRGMKRGEIHVTGNAGMHLGAYMKGGAIHVSGHASDWLGGEMAGGLIHVRGNAGGQIGAAYRGSVTGMRDGTILVEGSAGLEVAMRMKRGTIAIKGKVRDFAGLQMKGGTLVLMGGAEVRTGAWMARGTIITLFQPRLLPTFTPACSYQPDFLRIYAAYLARFGFVIPVDSNAGSYVRYTGDTSVPGKGEILAWQAV